MKPMCVLSLFCLDFSKSKTRREVSRLLSGCTVIGPEKNGVGPSLLLGLHVPLNVFSQMSCTSL